MLIIDKSEANMPKESLLKPERKGWLRSDEKIYLKEDTN